MTDSVWQLIIGEQANITRMMQHCVAISGNFTLRCTNIVKASETNVRPNKQMCVYGVACYKNDAELRRYFRKLYFSIAPLLWEALLYAAQTLSRQAKRTWGQVNTSVFMMWQCYRNDAVLRRYFGKLYFTLQSERQAKRRKVRWWCDMLEVCLHSR